MFYISLPLALAFRRLGGDQDHNRAWLHHVITLPGMKRCRNIGEIVRAGSRRVDGQEPLVAGRTGEATQNRAAPSKH